MKTKLFCLLAGLLLIGCTPPPSESCVKAYLDEVKLYYPYSTDENFVFKNEYLGLTWEAKIYNYPSAQMQIIDDVLAKSYGDWITSFSVLMQEDGMSPSTDEMSSLTTYISGAAKKADMSWFSRIRLSEEEVFYGYSFSEINGDFSMFTDTIIVPFEFEEHLSKEREYPSKERKTAPEGAYARIVKHEGLTDFSTDGKTVWRRVK